MYISKTEELNEFVERARRFRVIAVDTEFLREKTYHPMLCLIQVATAEEAVAIDPLAVDDMSALADLLKDASCTKVFHACDQDLEVIHDALGVYVEPVFDTQLAAAFLGHRMQLGYGALVLEYQDVRLPKADGLTDWSKRPLDKSQLEYALDDVYYLPAIYDQMMEDLIRRDRLGWFQPEMAALADPSRIERDPAKAYLHLKRSSSLTRKQLAIAREICIWRESVASRKNLPRKWVLSDDMVVEIARRCPTTLERLRRIRGTESISNRDADQLLKHIRTGANCNPADYPYIKHRARPNAQTDSVIDLMYALLRLISERLGVAIPLLATRDDLYEFAAGDKDCNLRKGWRYEVVGKTLDGLLQGAVGLTVKDGHIEML